MKKNKLKRLGILTLMFTLIGSSTCYASIEKGNGIDVSNYQTNINYQSAKNSGIEYAYVKSSEGTTFRDKLMNTHYNGFKSVGIKVGFYHFLSEWSSPTEQAEFAYSVVKNYNNDLYFVLDVEINTRCLSREQMSARIIEFCNRFTQLSGQKVILYSGSYFSRAFFTDEVVRKYPLWCASYNVNYPTVLNGTTLVGHQFTDRYYISGVGYVDANVFTNGIEMNRNSNNTLTGTQSTYNVNSGADYSKYKNYVGGRCAELQGLLNKYGYNLVVDGIYGYNTHKALGDFQLKHNLTVDYMAGENTFYALYNSNSGNNFVRKVQSEIGADVDGIVGNETLTKLGVVKNGNVNNRVILLQEKLNSLGYNCGSVDGIFGNNTKVAVVKYQKANGLYQDGIVGRNTWSRLLK